MKEPYESLLGHYRGHPILGSYLEDDEPAFSYLHNLLDMLGMEERIMVKVAYAFFNSSMQATVAELRELSDINLDRVIDALKFHRNHHLR